LVQAVAPPVFKMSVYDSAAFLDVWSQLKVAHDGEVEFLHSQIAVLRAALKKAAISDATIWTSLEDQPSVLNNDALPWGPASERPPVKTKSAQADNVDADATPKFEEKTAVGTDDAPSGFHIKMCWTKPPTGSSTIEADVDKPQAETYIGNMLQRVRDGSTDDSNGVKPVLGPPSCYLVNPGAKKRIMWDLCGMVLISYDLIAIPVHTAFEPEPHVFTTAMGWVTLIFWTLDMVTSIFTGYYQKGALIMDQKRIVVNYLKGWFWVDCIVVVPDWTMKGMGSVTNVAGLGRILRVARVMRVLRLLRLLKLNKLFAIVYDMIDSEVMFIIVHLVKLVIVIVVMNHLVACAWYLVGRLSYENGTPKNWLMDVGQTPVWDTNLEWKYLTSLHWSITQFTPASMDVSATNCPERLFSILILLWALVALSSIIGSVSASMTALRNMSSDENKNFWMLRRYLRQKHISKSLVQRIVKYLEHQQVAKHKVIAPDSVKLLGALSDQFQIELAHELKAPVMLEHPFFKYCDGKIPSTMRRLCNSALKTLSFAQNEVIFNPGDEGLRMYFVMLGNVEYRMVDDTPIQIPLGPKLWASEASLWTQWRHRGTLWAKIPSEIAGLLPGTFTDIFHMHPRPWYIAKNYAINFCNYLNSLAPKAQSDMIFDPDVWTAMVDSIDSYQLTRSSTLDGFAEGQEPTCNSPSRCLI